jgi:hypothetical protein
LFKDAGAHAVEITTRQGLAQFPSIQVMVEAELRGWLPVMGVFLTENQISDILKEAEDVLGPYTTPEGRVRFEISAHIVAAKKR